MLVCVGRLTRNNAPAHSFGVDSTWALSYNTKSRWSCDIIYQAPHCHRFFMSSGEPGNEAIIIIHVWHYTSTEPVCGFPTNSLVIMDNLPGCMAIKGAYLSLYSPFPAMQYIAPLVLINTISIIPVASVKPPIKVTTIETYQQRTSSKYTCVLYTHSITHLISTNATLLTNWPWLNVQPVLCTSEREQPLYAKDKTAAYQSFHCM